MTDDTPKPWTGIGAVAEVAATMMRAAFTLPLGTMRAACDLQERAIEVIESFVPGMHPEAQQPPGGISQLPAAPASVSASSTPGTAGATTGWGPVTQQNPVTGWGPMPR
ncbi:MAG TPA: hypothetical protein VG477_09660 [Thermoanaerobaculia bacterium]|nr:hypothetical protein [Thermoanaerobaculia bacterium]